MDYGCQNNASSITNIHLFKDGAPGSIDFRKKHRYHSATTRITGDSMLNYLSKPQRLLHDCFRLILCMVSIMHAASARTGSNMNPSLCPAFLDAKLQPNIQTLDISNIHHNPAWIIETFDKGQFNNEQQTYRNAKANLFNNDQGHLIIRALASQDTNGKRIITSARIRSAKGIYFTHGKISIRAKLPKQPASWPAFWALGASISEHGWPACGEIDILEHINTQPRVTGALHGPDFFGSNNKGHASPTLNVADWHTYSVLWTPNWIAWSVDDVPYGCVQKKHYPLPHTQWVFNQPFFLVLNLAMGGDYPNTPVPESFESASFEIASISYQPLAHEA